MSTRLLAVLSLAFACFLPLAHAAGPTGYLNDTGQTSCYKADNTVGDCAVDAADSGDRPRQDGRFGRDAKAGATPALTKTGGGAAGFDFSCVLWDGTVVHATDCTTTLVANTTATASGTPATDWACTKDNHTNLIWSLQAVSFIDWTNATATGDGSPIKAHNDASRCGFADGWRVPTRRELLSIVHHGASNPAIDGAYFPGSVASVYWSNDAYAPDSARAWYVDFGDGYSSDLSKTLVFYVRLVRSGP